MGDVTDCHVPVHPERPVKPRSDRSRLGPHDAGLARREQAGGRQDPLARPGTLGRADDPRLRALGRPACPTGRWTEARIRGHVMVCFLAFVLRQLMSKRLAKLGWTGSFTNLLSALGRAPWQGRADVPGAGTRSPLVPCRPFTPSGYARPAGWNASTDPTGNHPVVPHLHPNRSQVTSRTWDLQPVTVLFRGTAADPGSPRAGHGPLATAAPSPDGQPRIAEVGWNLSTPTSAQRSISIPRSSG